MTASCSCSPGACHGGHTIDMGMPLLTDEQLTRVMHGRDWLSQSERQWMAAELLAARARVTELEAIARGFSDQAEALATDSLEAAQREPIGYAAEQHRLRLIAFVEDMTHRGDVPAPLRSHAADLLAEVTR